MAKPYYERTDYSVVVKNRAPPPKGVEVGDLPGWKRQSDQAIIDLFRHYGGGQAGRKRCLKELLNKLLN
jgi:hypothetical protein